MVTAAVKILASAAVGPTLSHDDPGGRATATRFNDWRQRPQAAGARRRKVGKGKGTWAEEKTISERVHKVMALCACPRASLRILFTLVHTEESERVKHRMDMRIS
jgi:hypothetical protein